MGIGCYVNSLEELSKSYETAANVLKYRYTKGTGIIFDCEEERHKGNPLELEGDYKDISLAIRGNDEEVMEDAFRHMEHWMKSGYVSRNRAISYMQQVLRVVYETVHETERNFMTQDSVLTALTDARNLEEAMELTKRYARKGMESIRELGQTSGERQAVMAIDYMKDNYGNADLSLNSICEYLNISTSRFSTIFKEATGKTFTEVLTNIRMEKAKHLLTQTTLKNYEIAEKVGFSDPHYFSIAFKKATGMTPKEYAKGN